MKRMLRTVLLITLTLFPSAVALAQKVSFDFDKSANFSGFKTFGFKDGVKSGNPLVEERIAAAITASLGAKGLARSEGSPDLYVVTHLTFEKQKDISAYSSGMGYGPYAWHWGGGWGTTNVRVTNILIGTLVIDFIDAKKAELVWRGIGVREVKKQNKPDKIDKNVNEAVTKILRNYPPASAASAGSNTAELSSLSHGIL